MGNRNHTIRNKRKIKVTNYHNDVLDTKEANRALSKGFSRELKFTIISIFAVTIIMISSAFAIFSSIQKSENFNTLNIGTLKVDFIDTESGMGNIINLNGAYPESDEEGQKEDPYSFKITNSGNLSAKYVIKILDDTDMIKEDNCEDNLLDKSKLRISINGNTPINLSDVESNGYIILNGVLASEKSENYSIRTWISDTAGNEVLGKHYHGKIVVESENTTIHTNDNIKAVYLYDDVNISTLCITGEEETCQVSDCYENKTIGTCTQGTIVKYAVNDSEEKYFYVLHDDGETLTLQQRENTLSHIAWYATSNDNSQGPLTILPQLESATTSWTNVNDQTYTMGTTSFNGTNAFTGCSTYNTCTTNTYTLAERTAKARMITLQETSSLGCNSSNASCPKWMYNYLYQSTSYGGSIDDNSRVNLLYNYGYWTMSTYYPKTTYSWILYRSGNVGSGSTTAEHSGTRAVVVVSK